MPESYVPLSVREGGWRKKVGWEIKEARHRLALKIAPWFAGHEYPTPWAYEQACKALWKHRETLRDVAESGVTFDDERVGYVEVQIDRATWDRVRNA